MNQLFLKFPDLKPDTCLFTFCRNVEHTLYSRTQGTYTAWRFVSNCLTAEIHHLPADGPRILNLMTEKFKAEQDEKYLVNQV
jgi:hypothetical protein